MVYNKMSLVFVIYYSYLIIFGNNCYVFILQYTKKILSLFEEIEANDFK